METAPEQSVGAAPAEAIAETPALPIYERHRGAPLGSQQNFHDPARYLLVESGRARVDADGRVEGKALAEGR